MASWTTLENGSKFKQIDWGRQALPPCQGHLIHGTKPECDKPGEFDSPVQGHSAWADLCWKHALEFCPDGSSLGFHRIPFLNRSREEDSYERMKKVLRTP